MAFPANCGEARNLILAIWFNGWRVTYNYEAPTRNTMGDYK